MNKVLKVLSLSVLICLSLVIAPFHISANESLPSPFVGFNIDVLEYIEDTEFETEITSSGGTYSGSVARHSASVNLTGDFTAIERTSSGVTYMTTETSVGSVNGVNTQTGTITENAASESGTLTLNLSSSSSGFSFSSGVISTEIILDDNYIGYINVSLKYKLSSSQTQTRFTKNIYVNGNTVSFNYPESASSQSSLDKYSITINSFDLTRNIDNYWSYPIESYNFVSYFFGIKEPVSYYMNSDYVYPKFPISNGDQIWRSNVGAGKTHTLIFEIDKYVISSTLSNYISYPSDFSVRYTTISTNPLNDTNYGMTIKLEFTNNSNAQKSLQVNYIGADTQIMPIYSRLSTYRYLSTDFALLYGLSNDLLDAMVYGTDSSTSSQSDLAQSTDAFSSASNQLVTQEESFDTSMNTSLNNIDTNFDFGNKFGSKFLASADWVKVQYDNLTRTTPFGSVIGFSLLLGLALLLVGKVLR